jgi:uncharacterized phage-like protein YoqJ
MNADDFSPESINKTAFFSGHRLISETEKPMIRRQLSRCIKEAYDSGYRRFFCGCALGFDTIAAEETIRLRKLYPDIRLLLALPCGTQADRWSAQDQETYRRILELADEKTVLSPFYYQGAMLTRNRYMADRSSLCICWLRNMRGGTASTVRYAMLHGGIRIINLAVPEDTTPDQMKEKTWNFMYISPSAGKNAGTAPLRLLRGRRLIFRNIRNCCSGRH